MAQAKTKARTPAKPSGGSQKQSKAPKARKPAKAQKPAKRANAKSAASKPRPAIEGKAKDAGQAVSGAAKNAGHAVSGVASKAKVPLLASGAALAGAAGGLALGARGARGTRRRVKVDSHDLASAAKQVGSFGTQMGRLASELQRAREAANGNGKHRSPIEIVLEGLTNRGSRH